MLLDPSKISFPLDELREFIPKLKTEFIKNEGEVFLKNFENILILNILPEVIAASAGGKILSLGLFMGMGTTNSLFMKYGHKENFPKQLSSEITDSIIEEALDKYENNTLPQNSAFDKLGKEIYKSLVTKDQVFLEALSSSNNYLVAASWSFFEVLSKDMWVAVVNRHPKKFWNSIAGGNPTAAEDKKSMKQIPLQILAKHEFDISNQLGTIFASKFDFTKKDGICKSYEIIFEKTSDLTKVFDNPSLFKLEKTRHLIFHRAGKIDSEYLEQFPTNQRQLGQMLQLDESEISDLVGASMKAGMALLHFIDEQSFD